MSVRTERVAEEIRALAARFLLSDARAEGLQAVTISSVRIDNDLSLARVYYTVIGGEESRERARLRLKTLAPVLRAEVARGLNLRRAPSIQFAYDEHLDEANRIEALFQSLKKEE